jgi:hypothetical protein
MPVCPECGYMTNVLQDWIQSELYQPEEEDQPDIVGVYLVVCPSCNSVLGGA